MGGILHCVSSVGSFQSPFLVQSHLNYFDSPRDFCCHMKDICSLGPMRSWGSVVKLQGSNGTRRQVLTSLYLFYLGTV